MWQQFVDAVIGMGRQPDEDVFQVRVWLCPLRLADLNNCLIRPRDSAAYLKPDLEATGLEIILRPEKKNWLISGDCQLV